MVPTFFDLVEGVDLFGIGLDLLDERVDCLVHAGTDSQRVGAGGDVLQTVFDHDVSEQGRSRGAVASDVVGLDSGLADELGAHVLDLVLEFDLLCDGDAVVGDERRAVAALAGNVAALGAKGDLYRIGELGSAGSKRAAGVGIEANVLCSHVYRPFLMCVISGERGYFVTTAYRSSPRRMR